MIWHFDMLWPILSHYRLACRIHAVCSGDRRVVTYHPHSIKVDRDGAMGIALDERQHAVQ